MQGSQNYRFFSESVHKSVPHSLVALRILMRNWNSNSYKYYKVFYFKLDLFYNNNHGNTHIVCRPCGDLVG